MGLIAMSERDLQRIEVLSKVIDGRTTIISAAHVLALSTRQVRRLLERIRTDGAASIRHRELRLAGICDMEAGNAFLPGFMERYNARFAVTPARSGDLHRPVNLALDWLAGDPVQARAALRRRAADVFVRAQAHHAREMR